MKMKEETVIINYLKENEAEANMTANRSLSKKVRENSNRRDKYQRKPVKKYLSEKINVLKRNCICIKVREMQRSSQ